MSLREEIKQTLIRDGYKGNQEYYMSDDELADLIVSIFEKRIDYVEQRAIEYITCKDEGDPSATKELADIMNDYSTENCWRGMKIIIKDFKELLK
jgi:hypothetical protein